MTKLDNNDEGTGEITKPRGRKEWRVIKQRQRIRAKYDYSEVYVKRTKIEEEVAKIRRIKIEGNNKAGGQSRWDTIIKRYAESKAKCLFL